MYFRFIGSLSSDSKKRKFQVRNRAIRRRQKLVKKKKKTIATKARDRQDSQLSTDRFSQPKTFGVDRPSVAIIFRTHSFPSATNLRACEISCWFRWLISTISAENQSSKFTSASSVRYIAGLDHCHYCHHVRSLLVSFYYSVLLHNFRSHFCSTFIFFFVQLLFMYCS